MLNRLTLAVLSFALAVTCPPSMARGQEATSVEEVVVTARRSGAPVWHVTREDATLIVVGAIDQIPASVAWHPAALEQAVAQADVVVFPQVADYSAADFLRVIWRARSIGLLPNGTTTATYLTPDQQSRFVAVDPYSGLHGRQNMILTADILLRKRIADSRSGEGPLEVARRAARRSGRRVLPVAVVSGDSLLTIPPERQAPCLAGAVEAVEAGDAGLEARARDWAHGRIPSVLASPLDRAYRSCWPEIDPALATRLRNDWRAAVTRALSDPSRVVLIVAPIELLAESGGLLDRLRDLNADIEGPDWKVEEGAP